MPRRLFAATGAGQQLAELDGRSSIGRHFDLGMAQPSAPLQLATRKDLELASHADRPPSTILHGVPEGVGTGSICSTIPGATGQSYTLTSAEVGRTIRVQETAANAGGSGSAAISARTSAVQAQNSDGAGTVGSVGGGTGVTTGGSDSSGTAGGATGTSSSGTGGDLSSTNSSGTGDRPSGTTSRGSARAVPTFGRVKTSAAGASLSVACRGSRGSSCTFLLRLTLKGKGTTLGSHSVSLAAGRRETVTIRLNRTAKRLLNQRHKLTTKFTVIQNRAAILQKLIAF